jgi:hypothetical protein
MGLHGQPPPPAPTPPRLLPPDPLHFYKFKSFGVPAFLATLQFCLIWQRRTDKKLPVAAAPSLATSQL